MNQLEFICPKSAQKAVEMVGGKPRLEPRTRQPEPQWRDGVRITGSGAHKRSWEDLLKSFWDRVDKNSPNGCWNWTGGLNVKIPGCNYGKISWGAVKFLCHKFSYALHFGEVPKGLLVLHKCDNPPCVNPSHLFLGTHLDNSRDCFKKGRNNSLRGKKLTEKSVREIRSRFVPACKTNGIIPLAKELGVGPATISRVCSRKSWKHVL